MESTANRSSSESVDAAASNMSKANQDAVLRIEQQLQIQKKLRNLEKDISRVSKLGKSKVDSLTSLESRVLALKEKIRDNLNSKSAEDEVKDALSNMQISTSTSMPNISISNTSSKPSTINVQAANARLLKFQICPRCNRKILSSLYKTHENSCRHISEIEENEYTYTYISNTASSTPNSSTTSVANKSRNTLGVNRLNPQNNIASSSNGLTTQQGHFGGIDYDTNLTKAAALNYAFFTPKPPRNIQLKSYGSDYIEFIWLPPLSDGGTAVIDYEITYLQEYYIVNPETKIPKLQSSKISFKTSNWCLQKPVYHNGYKISNRKIRADTMYSQIQVRSWNIIGCSEWVNALSAYEDIITTNPAQKPSAPLLITVTKITSSCCHIDWNNPYSYGGLPITKYRVEYTLSEKQTTANKTIYVEHTYVIHEPSPIPPALLFLSPSSLSTTAASSANAPSVSAVPERDPFHHHIISDKVYCVIRNIPSDTEIVKIMVSAINESNLKSPAARLLTKGLRTYKGSKYDQLSRQLLYAKSFTTKFIDTDFFTGVHQRVLREEFIVRINQELSHEEPTEEEMEETEEWSKILTKDAKIRADQNLMDQEVDDMLDGDGSEEDDGDSSDEGKSENKDSSKSRQSGNSELQITKPKKPKKEYIFTTNQRRRHYQYKIRIFENKLRKLKIERNKIDSRRIELSEVMKNAQSKQYLLKLEKDRFANYKENVVTSAVIHGYEVRYQFTEFLSALNNEIQKCSNIMKNSKLDIIKDERRRREVLQLIETIEPQMQERKVAFTLFEKKVAQGTAAVERLKGGSGYTNEVLKKMHFDQWKQFLSKRKNTYDKMITLFNHKTHNYLVQSFHKWSRGVYPHELDKVSHHALDEITRGVTGIGSHLLKLSEDKRKALQEDIKDILISTSAMNHELKLNKMNHDSKVKLTQSKNYQLQEESFNIVKMINVSGMKYLYQGDAYTQQGLYDRARDLYESQIIYLTSQQTNPNNAASSISAQHHMSASAAVTAKLNHSILENVADAEKINNQQKDYSKQIVNQNVLRLKYMALCYGRLGRNYMLQELYDQAIVEFDRQKSIAKEAQDESESADAYFGLGYGYMKMFNYEEAIRYLDISQSKYESLQNNDKLCEALIALETCYERLGRLETSKNYQLRIQQLQEMTITKFRNMRDQLTDFQTRLIGTAASAELIVNLERITLKAVELRRNIEIANNEITRIEIKSKEQNEKCLSIENILDAIDIEMSEAEETDELEMWSSLVHDQAQLVDVEELKVRLATRKDIEIRKLVVEKNVIENYNIQMDNLLHEISEYEEILKIEYGPLIKSSIKKVFRQISFAYVNVKSDEVTGGKTGGVENFVAVEGNNIHLFNYLTGEVITVFTGGKNVTGQVIGHTGVITCVTLDNQFIYSGSIDEMIIVWNMSTRQRVMMLSGHEGSIVALSVSINYLVSSSSDCTMRIWDKITGQQMRVVTGHLKSVLSLEIDDNRLVSGSTDGEIRFWNITQKTKKSISVDCKLRLLQDNIEQQVSDYAVTCVRHGSHEIVSGDSQGNILIWWLETGELLKTCKGIHKGKVTCLQFDAVYIVSGGVDAIVCILDIASGDVLQTLRGHDTKILNLAFDSVRILTASSDNTLRYWKWGQRNKMEDKVHVLSGHETLLQVTKLYNITMDDLMLWNGIRDPRRQVYSGLALIVKKADPDAPTKAEKAVIDKQRRLQMGKQNASGGGGIEAIIDTSNSQQSGPPSALEETYNRVRDDTKSEMKNAPETMGNRMFAKYKHDTELFPAAFDPNDVRHGDASSLAARIISNGKKKVTNNPGIGIFDNDHHQQQPVDQDDDEGGGNEMNRNRYQFSSANIDRWGTVSDNLSHAMLNMFIERELQEIVREIVYQESHNIGKYSVGGRISNNVKNKIILNPIEENDEDKNEN